MFATRRVVVIRVDCKSTVNVTWITKPLANKAAYGITADVGTVPKRTSGSAMAEGPREALVSRNPATTKKI